MLLLWILFVIYVSCLSCCLVWSLQPCGHLLGNGWPLVTFPCGVPVQMWYLIVSIPDLCLLLTLKHGVSLSVTRFLHQNKSDLVAILYVKVLIATSLLPTIHEQSLDLQTGNYVINREPCHVLKNSMEISAYFVAFCANVVTQLNSPGKSAS